MEFPARKRGRQTELWPFLLFFFLVFGQRGSRIDLVRLLLTFSWMLLLYVNHPHE